MDTKSIIEIITSILTTIAVIFTLFYTLITNIKNNKKNITMQINKLLNDIYEKYWFFELDNEKFLENDEKINQYTKEFINHYEKYLGEIIFFEKQITINLKVN